VPWVGFEPTIPVFKRAKTFNALNRAATVIGGLNIHHPSNTIWDNSNILEAYLIHVCIINKSTHTSSYPQIHQSILKLGCLSQGTETWPMLHIAYHGSGKLNKIKNCCLKYLGLAVLLWADKRYSSHKSEKRYFPSNPRHKIIKSIFGVAAFAHARTHVHTTLTSEHKRNRKLLT
jgi:hypothetical protein